MQAVKKTDKLYYLFIVFSFIMSFDGEKTAW